MLSKSNPMPITDNREVTDGSAISWPSKKVPEVSIVDEETPLIATCTELEGGHGAKRISLVAFFWIETGKRDIP